MNAYKVEVEADGDEIRTYLVRASDPAQAERVAREHVAELLDYRTTEIDDPGDDDIDFDLTLEQEDS